MVRKHFWGSITFPELIVSAKTKKVLVLTPTTVNVNAPSVRIFIRVFRSRVKMMKSLLVFALFLSSVLGTANYVYFAYSGDTPGGNCSTYTNTLTPSQAVPLVINFKVEFLGYTTNASVYYTTNGSLPNGSHGVGAPGTSVIQGLYNCTAPSFGGGATPTQIVSAFFPAFPPGTTVNFVIGSWFQTSGTGNTEIFANSNSCTSLTATPYCATVFSFNTSLPATSAATSATSATSAGTSATSAAGTSATSAAATSATSAAATSATSAAASSGTSAAASSGTSPSGTSATPSASQFSTYATNSASFLGISAALVALLASLL